MKEQRMSIEKYKRSINIKNIKEKNSSRSKGRLYWSQAIHEDDNNKYTKEQRSLFTFSII